MKTQMMMSLLLGSAAAAYTVTLPAENWIETLHTAYSNGRTVVEKTTEGTTVGLNDLLAPFFPKYASEPYISLRSGTGEATTGEATTADDLIHQLIGDTTDDAPKSAVFRIELLPTNLFNHLLGPAAKTKVENGDWSAHLYISADGSAALGNHTDVTDVAVWQLAGTKDWLRCKGGTGKKLDMCATYDGDEMNSMMNQCDHTDLGTGMSLFVPRRTVHSATAVSELSVHLTIGFESDKETTLPKLPWLLDEDDDHRRRLAQCNSCERSTSCPAGTSSTIDTDGTFACNSCDESCDRLFGNGCDRCNECNGCDPCAEGTFAASTRSTSCTECPPGQFASETGSTSCEVCESGKFSSSGAANCDDCAPGAFSASPGSAECLGCAAGRFSVAGASTCEFCAAGTFAENSGSETCLQCPIGTFSANDGSEECTVCPPGTFQDSEGSTSCQACPAGRFNIGGINATSHDNVEDCVLASPGFFVANESSFAQDPCPFGTFQPESGQTTCEPCGSQSSFESFFLRTQSGLTASTQCECETEFTGANCDLAKCAETLPLVSLGLLLLEASYPEELRESARSEDERQAVVVSTASRIEAIFRTADKNGDDILSVEEAATALALVDVDVTLDFDDFRSNIWSRPPEDGRRVSIPIAEGDILISAMIADAIENFVLWGTFYVADFDLALLTVNDTITQMNATYPASGYSLAQCEDDIDDGVKFQWTFRETERRQLQQQCAYVNGKLLPSDVFTNEMADAALVEDGGICIEEDGLTSCSFHDQDGVDDNNRKRLYCIRQRFCGAGPCGPENVDEGLTSTRCTTGLAFDGRPADVTPTYSLREGVKFQWLDTSLDEAGFRIFRAAEGTTGALTEGLGQLIADIPVTSGKCGQQFAPLQFTDFDIGQTPSSRVDYLVATVDSDGSIGKVSRTRFTSPWAMILTVTVETETGNPVRDAIVKVQHLLEQEGQVVVDPTFEINLITDAFGTAIHEVAVIDPILWSSDQQHLRISAIKCDGGTGESCEGGFLHTFDKPFEDIEVRHLLEDSVALVDTSARSVSGFVLFGEGDFETSWRDSSYIGGDWDPLATCPFTLDDGRCYCPITGVQIELEYDDGEIESFDVDDETGFFSADVALGRSVTVRFLGFDDHNFDLWQTSFDGVDLGQFIATGLQPTLRIENMDSDVNLALVNANRGDLSALVVGGIQDVRFITGQQLIVKRDACGYRRKIVTAQSEANVTLAAADFRVELPLDLGLSPCSAVAEANPGDPSFVPGTPCRVEAVNFTSSSERHPCAVDPRFQFVDEFFQVREQPVNFITGDLQQQIVYRYAAPLCLVSVTVGPTEGNTFAPLAPEDDTRQVFDEPADAVIPWIVDRPEALMLFDEVPEILEDDENATIFGRAVTSSGEALFTEGDAVSVKFSLAEVYPLCRWPWDYVEGNCDFFVDDQGSQEDKVRSTPTPDEISVTVLDGISGKDVEVLTYVTECDTTLDARFCVGLDLEIQVGDPNPFAPFTLPLEMLFQRAIDGSAIAFLRDAVIIGTIPEDVPQTYTMTTDPSFIFAVIRDPPGGSSSTTLAKGSSIETSLSIDGMHTAERSKSEDLAFRSGADLAISTMIAPLGLGLENSLSDLNIKTGRSWKGNAPVVKGSRGSDEHFDLAFTFDTDISTSTQPWTAGQPSDVIVGGGFNLRVSRAIETRLTSIDDSRRSFTILGAPTSQFLPEQISTFVMSVHEIELLMERLAAQNAIDASEDIVRAIDNWEAVLRNYRAQTASNDNTNLADSVATLFDHLQVAFTDARDETTSDEGFSDRYAAALDEMDDPEKVSEDYAEFLGNGLIKLENIQRDALTSRLGSNRIAFGTDIALSALKPTSIRDAFAKLIGGTIIAAAGSAFSNQRKQPEAVGAFLDIISDKLATAHQENCLPGGLVVPGGTLCDGAREAKSRIDLAKNLMGICDLQRGVLKSVDAFCQERDDSSLPQSVFDFISDDTKLVTFGGGASVDMTYTIQQTKAVNQEAQYTADSGDQYDSSTSFCISVLRRERNRRLLATASPLLDERRRLEAPTLGEIGRQEGSRDLNNQDTDKAEASADKPDCRRLISLGFGRDTSEAGSLSVQLGKAATRDRGASHTVSMTLQDDDVTDYFAVRVSADSVYATPIFETLGGASQCPGETGTSKKDSFITIERINYDYCNAAGFPLCQNVPHGTTVTLGVVVQNLSPLALQPTFPERQKFYFKLFAGANGGVANAFQDGTDLCGTSGYAGGLDGLVEFQRGGLPVEIPFGQSEILFNLDHTTGLKECLSFNDIEVRLVSECEYATPTYQYRTAFEDGSVSIIHPQWDNATRDWVPETRPHFPERYYDSSDGATAATFSLSWTPLERRKLSAPPDETPVKSVSPETMILGLNIIIFAANFLYFGLLRTKTPQTPIRILKTQPSV